MPSHSRVSGGVLKEVDLRRARRYSDKGSMIQASWIDAEGNVNVGMVRVINISETGLALELPVVPQQAAMVRIQSDRHKLTGAAMVRHVSEQGSRCVVGLEFANGMRWTPPWVEDPEPGQHELMSSSKDERIRSTVTTTVGLQPTTVPLRPRLKEIKPPAATNVVVMKAPDAAETAGPIPTETKPVAVVNTQPELDEKRAETKQEESKPADEKPAETAVTESAVHSADEKAATVVVESAPIVAVIAANDLNATDSVKAADAKAAEASATVTADAVQPESKPAAQPISPAAELAKEPRTAEPTPHDAPLSPEAEGSLPAETAAAEPVRAETIKAEPANAEPAKPQESPVENLDDFWGWTKQ